MGRPKLLLHLLPLDELLSRRTAVDVNTGCYLWTGPHSRDGYGILQGTGLKAVRAHRHVWALANGREIPAGLIVRHKCDNPPCVNPQHLEVGTRADNMADKVQRERAHWQLTSAKVREIRRQWRTGRYNIIQLAKMYRGISESRLIDVVDPRRQHFRHISR